MDVGNLTPLGLGITKDQGKNILVVQKLLEAGGDPNSIVRRGNNTIGRTTALLAEENGHLATKNYLKLLYFEQLSYGALLDM